jgi:hypothetical protein
LTAATAPNADFNGDDVVDGHDFLAWQLGVGAANANPADGDANGDGAVDSADLGIWQTQFGAPAPAAASGAASSLATAKLTVQPSLSSDEDLVALAQHELSAHEALSTGRQVFEEPDQSTTAVSSPALGGRSQLEPAAADDDSRAVARTTLESSADDVAIDSALESFFEMPCSRLL